MVDATNLYQEIVTLLEQTYKSVLVENRKVATRRVLNSIKGQFQEQAKGAIIKILADQGLFYIESGKRANTKLPVRKVGDKFELFPRIQEWRDVVGFGGSDYQLAKAIAKKARKGVPITEIVLQRALPQIRLLVRQWLRNEFTNFFVAEVRKIYSTAI